MRAIVLREDRRARAERQAARAAFETDRRRDIADELARRRAGQVRSAAVGTVPKRATSSEHERRRVDELVLGRPIEVPIPVRPAGMSKLEWKGERRRLLDAHRAEQAASIRVKWAGKQGTPETLEHHARTREGSLRRLYETGAIDAEQLASAVEIATVHERISADVSIRTASLEARVDHQRHGDGFYEMVSQVRREMAYTRWRAEVEGPIAAVLDMIVGDAVGFTVVARRYRMHNRRAKKLLIDALDRWPRVLGQMRREVDTATLAAAHAGILA